MLSTTKNGFVSFCALLLLLTLTVLSGGWSAEAKRRDKRIYMVSIFYDDTYENIEDLTQYSVEIIERNLRRSDFRFEYTIHRVYQNSSFKLTKLRKLGLVILFNRSASVD